MVIVVKCKRRVAADSPDHKHPFGTRLNNSKNRRFNEYLYRIFGNKKISVLDLGCAGGGFVKDVIDDGNVGVGLEGSDYSKKEGRAEWKAIPDNLFVCDITRRFDIYSAPKKRLEFDAVTAWEVLEHIKESDINALADNVKRHMKDKAIWVLSISNGSSIADGVELHQTQQPKEWWIKKFRNLGLYHKEEYVKYFNLQFVRGDIEHRSNFHLVLCKNPDSLPPPPRIAWIRAIADSLPIYIDSGLSLGFGYFKYKFKLWTENQNSNPA